MKIVKEKIEQNPENATALLAKMKEHLGAAASKLVHSGVTQKYTSINTKDKYVEFRGPGGDYLDEDLTKLTSTALRLAQALRIATDDNAYKQEYAKKLYKLVSPSEGDWTDPNNSVSLFSRYAMGQINKDELVSNVRQAQAARKEKKGEERQFWVMNKDGTGGKQMVFAASETEAIIKGGKQMGMSREQSISKLKAELFKQPAVGPAPTKPIPEKLTGGWTDWIKDRAPRADVDDLLRIERDLKDGNFDYLDDESTQYLIDYIGELIEFRKQGDDTPPESLSQSWKDWVEENLPNVTVDTINSVRQRIINGGDQLGAPAEAWIIRQIDAELRSRMDRGVVDGNETRWKVTLDIWENTAYRMVEPVYVDADSPRQAKVKAKEMFQREAGIDVPLNHMEATATTQDAGRPEQSYTITDPMGRQTNTVQARSSDEALRIFGSTNDIDPRNYTAAPTNATTGMTANSREVFDSLPAGWQGTLTRVGEIDSGTLQSYVNHILTLSDNVLSVEQKDFMIQALNTEMRRRRNNDELAANAGRAENAVRDSLPEAHRNWLNDIANKSDMDLINVLRNMSTSTVLNEQQAAYFRITIKHELRRRGINPDVPAEPEQPADLSSPDDETIDDVMGGDSDEETPPDGAGTWTVGNHTYGRETFQANSRDEAIQAYAERNGITVADLTADRSFVADLAQTTQTNESIKELRRLAGLR